MPEMDGYQLLEHLRRRQPRHIPVIVLSAVEDMDNCTVHQGTAGIFPSPPSASFWARVALEEKHLYDQQVLYLQQLETFNETLEQRV
jgi:CheY-like chemotaxis protein